MKGPPGTCGVADRQQVLCGAHASVGCCCARVGVPGRVGPAIGLPRLSMAPWEEAAPEPEPCCCHRLAQRCPWPVQYLYRSHVVW